MRFVCTPVAELIGLYLLHQISGLFPKIEFGLYRDDGLAVLKGNTPGPERDQIRKKLIQFFKEHNLKITIETNLKVVNFLDITLNIENRKYWPYSKPNNTQQYINTKSNHPQSSSHTYQKQ